MRLSITAFALILSGPLGCKVDAPEDRSSLHADDGLPGNLRASLAETANASLGEFDLQVSAPSTTATVSVCSGTVLVADCRTGALGYRSATKSRSSTGVDIFNLDRPVNPATEQRLVIVARDVNGQVTESQPIVFSAKGTSGQNGQNGQTAQSNGSGGQKGSFEGTFGTGGRFMINVPQDNGPAKAHGLLVLLHGSQASSYDRFVQEMAAVSQQYNLIPVSVLAPNGQGWNEGGEQQAADYLDGLIAQKLFVEYNIDKKKIFFSGQSSGGGFLASHFIPLKGANYQGGAFLQCGMMPPQVQFTATEAMKRNFKLHFEITSDDGIWTDNYGPAINAYKTAGLVVTSDNTKSGGHCGFDQAAIISQYIGQMITP